MRFLIPMTLLMAITCGTSLWALEAGAAKMEITPETGLPMMGFGGRIAQAVLDPLNVRTVVFRSDGGSVALVVYDLLFPFEDHISSRISQLIRERTGVEQVVYSATHTHSGPEIHWDTPLAEDEDLSALPDFEQMIIAKTIEVVDMACEKLQPVKLGVSWGKADVSYNRLEKLDSGGVSMKWANHEKNPMDPVDQTLGVIRIDDLSGQPVAILVNYACHPVIHGKPGSNLMYSADFPGVLCRQVNENLHGDLECIFFNGACGDINPYYAHSVDDPGPRMEEVGRLLADEVVRIASGIMTKTGPETSIQSRIEHYVTEGRWDTRKMVVAGEDTTGVKQRAARIDKHQQDLNLALSIVLITPEIGFVGLPGEFFWEFQEQLRASAPVDYLFVTGYTNQCHGYFPTIKASVAGGYGANDEAVRVAAGAGEHLIVNALVSINEMLGKLRDLPSSGKYGYKR